MKEKYISVFMQAFNLDRDEVDGSVAMGKTEGWDSVGHVQFISLSCWTPGISSILIHMKRDWIYCVNTEWI